MANAIVRNQPILFKWNCKEIGPVSLKTINTGLTTNYVKSHPNHVVIRKPGSGALQQTPNGVLTMTYNIKGNIGNAVFTHNTLRNMDLYQYCLTQGADPSIVYLLDLPEENNLQPGSIREPGSIPEPGSNVGVPLVPMMPAATAAVAVGVEHDEKKAEASSAAVNSESFFIIWNKTTYMIRPEMMERSAVEAFLKQHPDWVVIRKASPAAIADARSRGIMEDVVVVSFIKDNNAIAHIHVHRSILRTNAFRDIIIQNGRSRTPIQHILSKQIDLLSGNPTNITQGGYRRRVKSRRSKKSKSHRVKSGRSTSRRSKKSKSRRTKKSKSRRSKKSKSRSRKQRK